MSSVVIATDQPSEPESNPNNNAASMHSMAQTSNAILARLKEVRTVNLNTTKHDYYMFCLDR